MNVTLWCDRIIRWCFALLFILVPLILTPVNYELFEYNKMMVTYGLTVVIVGAWLVKMIARKEIHIARTPLDIPLALFFISQLLSSLFSMDPHVSWFGYYSRFNGGMWSIISYVLLYYAFVSNVSPITYHISRLLKIALATGVIVALYGVAERLGIDKHLWVQDVQNRVFSSLGQPNWLAAYLVALAPIAWALALKARKYWSLEFVIWNLTAILFFTVLLFTRSRSGLLGFTVADVVFWGLFFGVLKFNLFSKKVKPFEAKFFLVPFFILHAAFLIIVFFNGTYVDSIDRWVTFNAWKERILLSVNSGNPRDSRNLNAKDATPSASYTAPLLESGGTESGTIRKYVWQGAIAAWRSSVKTFLIGTGTETFAFAFFQYRPAGHNMTTEWDYLYNKAHNEYLNYLATTGILGLGSYLLFIGTFIYWFVKTQMSKLKVQNNIWILQLALFAGWLSILVTNFFGFSVVIVQLFLFLFPAMMMTSDKAFSFKFSLPYRLSLFLVLLVLFALVILLSRMWYADTLFAAGYRLARVNQYAQAQPLILDAIKLNAGEPLYHDEYSTTLAALTAVSVEQQQATLAAALAKQALTESDTAISISPKNVNFWKSRTKIFYSFSSFDPQFNPASIQALTRAWELSPNDPKIMYNLAILYGRQNDNAKAIEVLQKSIAMKPNYRDAYFALNIFYQEIKDTKKAREILQEYLQKVDPNDKDFLERTQ